HTADRVALPADPLRRRVDHDVCAMLDRPAEDRGRERVVDDERNASRVCDIRETAKVGNVEPWVPDRLDVDRPRRVVDGGLDGGEVVRIDELRGDAQPRQGVPEERGSPAVERL